MYKIENGDDELVYVEEIEAGKFKGVGLESQNIAGQMAQKQQERQSKLGERGAQYQRRLTTLWESNLPGTEW